MERAPIPSPCPSSTVRSRTGAGSTGKTAFTTTTGHMHRAQRGGIGASLQRGLVMTRKKAETQRLPAECYDVRPKPRGHN